MALFRKIFYKKPPDGLLEISERVYVFDYCFSTDVLEEDDYNVYIGGITEQLREHFPDASFMVFNFREGEKESQISSILSEYDMTVMDYPRHYEGCPLLTMEMIHHFLRSSESWLCLGPHNVLLMHCERGGWPVLAFMLAALLIYCKQYTGEQKTLEMIYKQAPHELLHLLSPLDPVPSQLRYLQYVSRRNVVSEWPPHDRALTLDCIMLRMIPNFDGEGGCRPIFRIYGQDPFTAGDRTTKVLFSTPKKRKYVRIYRQTECELVKIDIHCHIQGDVVLECISLDDDLEREQMMFRVMFNTAFIRSNIMMVNRDQIDILWDSKDRFPKDFRAEVLLSEMDAASSVVNMELTSGEEKEGLPIEAFAKVQEIFSNVDWQDVKGDAALHVLQKLTSSNALQEISEVLSPRAMPRKSTFSKLTEQADHDVANNNAVSDVNNTRRTSLLSYSSSAASGSSELALQKISEVLSPWVMPRKSTPSKLTEKADHDVSNNNTVSDVNNARHPSLLLYSSSAASGSSEPASNQNISVIPSPPPPPPLPPLATTPKASATNFPSASPPPPPPPPPPIQLSVKLSPPLSSLSSSPPPDHLPPSKSVATIPHPPPPPPFLGPPSTHRQASSNTSTKSLSTPPHPPPPPPPPTSSTQCPPAPPIMKPGGLVGAPPAPPPPPSRPKTAAPMASPSAPPPPPPPQFTLKQSTVPTPPKPSPVPTVPPPMSSQGSLKSSQSSSMGSKGTGSEFVPPPPAALPISSLGIKGRSLALAKSARSLQSTQSSSKRISLKPLHWVKVTRAMQGSLWAETEKSDEASKAPEIDMSDLAEFFSTNSESGLTERTRRRSSLGGKPDKVHLIDLRRANNCEIMLTKVKIPLPDLMSSLLALDDSLLDADQVDNLIKFCPTKEEMDLLKGYNGDKEKLGKCEQFFLELMKVPRVEAKLRVFSFKIQFRTQVSDLRSSLNIVNSAAEEIRNSVKLKRIMQTILSLGNALNQGTARGSAIGFRLDSLLKLIDTRARNNKTTLMHYLCKVLADKLPEVLDFPKDLVSLEAASKIQLKILAEEMQAISKGLEKVEQELTSSENDGPVSATFCKTLKEFLVIAEAEVRSLTSLYSGVGRNADALALYFGEDPARCPFEQVISTLLNFTKMFARAHEENCKQLELEKKKTHHEAENLKLKLASHKRETENVLRPPIRSGETQ